MEYRFRIDAYSPETIPMARLAEYMADLASLFGEKGTVHFVRLEGGSTALVSRIEREAERKVQNRLHAVKNNEGPIEARDAFERLDDRLTDDNATGRLETIEGAHILQFPGRERTTELQYGPFNEPGTIQGQVILVGGRRHDTIPVHIQDGTRLWLCQAPKELARRLAQHIFGPTIRVSGVGRWLRSGDGRWTQVHFVISDFVILDDESLPDTVRGIRRLDADWKAHDPLGALGRLRSGEDG